MTAKMSIRFLVAVLAAVWLVQFAATGSALEPDTRRIAQASRDVDSGDSKSIASHPAKFVGVGSCAASNCHGGDGSQGPHGSEYSVWIQEDPHAKAYAVLYNDLSKRMAELLKLDKPAHLARVCLNCHAPTSNPQTKPVEAAQSELLDGVSCEACHGAATHWLEPHVRKDWAKQLPAMKQKLGFYDTKSLHNRARICLNCHVAGAGEVTHDLYAAGHPRMAFELAAYHSNMPAHWNRGDDPPEGQIWAVGQFKTASTTAELLAMRATPAKPGEGSRRFDYREVGRGPWPEFAEIGCFACHHDLVPSSWRRHRGFRDRRPGGLPWQTWNLALTDSLAMHLDLPELPESTSPLRNLRRMMARLSPDRDEVVSEARGLAVAFDETARQLANLNWTRERDDALLKLLANDGQELVTQNWDAATQVYLGLAALQQSRLHAARRAGMEPDAEDRRIRESLESIRANLEFEPLDDSPRQFADDRIVAIRAALKTIHEAVSSEGE